jgi:hypothetical protein
MDGGMRFETLINKKQGELSGCDAEATLPGPLHHDPHNHHISQQAGVAKSALRHDWSPPARIGGFGRGRGESTAEAKGKACDFLAHHAYAHVER